MQVAAVAFIMVRTRLSTQAAAAFYISVASEF